MKKYKFIILFIVALIIVSRGLAEPYRVSGDCMEPAFTDGQRYFLNRVTPYLRDYKLNDIVLFKHEGKVWISRIVALEKDTIQITEGKLVVNAVYTPDNEIRRNWSNWKFGIHAIDQPLQVPPNHVFVLSDNLSAHHDDSRVFGPVSKESILGLVW